MTNAAHLYVGCTPASSPVGVRGFAVHADGTLVEREQAITEQASFVAVGPGATTLYAVRETAPDGAVVAIRRTGDGLTVVDEAPSHGAGPCHLSVRGSTLFVANYISGSVAAYRLDADGGFGELLGTAQHQGTGPHRRQDGPHAHCIVPAPDGRTIHAVDLGTDRIVHSVLDGDGSNRLRRVGETVFAPGSGPRHLTFHPNLPVAFAVCELDCTLVTLDVDDDGTLRPRSVRSTLPDDCTTESTAAEVCVHPAGDHVYVSNRGHDSIATFAVHAAHDLELVGHVPSGGRTPRHIAVDPTGSRLLAANQGSDTIVGFDLADRSRPPDPIGVLAEVPAPSCLVFVEDRS